MPLFFRSTVASNLAPPFYKTLTFVFLPAVSGNSQCSVRVPLTNTVLLLGAPMLPTWRWVKISTYLHLELFHSIAYMLLILDRILLLLCSSFVFNSDMHYCYYSYNSDLHYYYYYYIIIIINFIELLLLLYCLFRNSDEFCSHLSFPIIFVCLFSAIMCSSNLSFTLFWVCPLCTYVCLHCAVSVIGLVAVNSAQK
jgi:hypothetical protein